MEAFFSNIYKDKTVLVTGDTGFKGSWLIIWLLQLGAKVIGYGLKPKTNKDNYVICDLEKKINHLDGDIRDYQKLLKVFQDYKPEIVFHLAAQSLVLNSYQDPVYTHSTNIMGTVNLLEAVRNSESVKAVINVTSDKCYENKEWIYGYKEIDPLGGNDPYSASKAASEIITASYINSFFTHDDKARIATARAGNVIGGGDFAENRIFPDCIKSLKENRAIIVRNPEAARPWQHVLEPLSGYLTLGSALFINGKKYSGAWNFGPLAKNIIPVKELVEKTIEYWGSGDYLIQDNNSNKLEANLLQLDISKAVNFLKWHPVLNFSRSVKFSVDEYKVDNLNSEEIFDQRVQHIEEYIKLGITVEN